MSFLRLALMVSPTLLGSIFTFMAAVSPARAEFATPIPVPAPDVNGCRPNPHQKFQLICTRLGTEATVVQASGDANGMPPAVLEFSEEESNAAIALFGCDCPLCLNALRQMRGLPPLNQLG
ncbi:hypothetical protein [Parathermosynechococcus lividus]